MISREEISEIVDTASCEENLEDVLRVAEELAPGNQAVQQTLRDLHETYFLSEDALEYYVDRLERIIRQSS